MHRRPTIIGLIAAGCAACAGPPSPSITTRLDSPQSALVAQIEILSDLLPSGYRVVLARTPAVTGRDPRIYIASYVLHGSMQDSMPGWAHLMEHIAANNRSTIAGPVRPEGLNIIESNALARPYYTSFVTVVPPALLPSVMHSRMARAGRAENDSQVYATQVGRVLAELERDLSWQYPAIKSLVSLARGRSPKLSDEMKVMRETTSPTLAAAMNYIYRPDNAVLVIAGDINLEETRAMVRETDTRLRLRELRTAAPFSLPVPVLRTGQEAVIEGQNRSAHNVVGVSWMKPPLGHADQLALLIADQLMLGRGDSVADPVRSDSSAIAIRLARSLGGSSFWDGRAGKWGAIDLVDTGPGVQAVVFNTDQTLTLAQVRDSVTAALRDIRSNAMTDAEIEQARERLASFYERWFFEPMYRTLSDHLMAYAATGRDPRLVKEIPAQIRRVQPSAVRAAFDRYLLGVRANIVILPSGR